MIRLQFLGEHEVCLFDLTSLKDVAQAKTVALLKAFLAGNEVNFENLHATAEAFYMGTVQKGYILFVPVGWFMIEHYSAGPLNYGFRKSVSLETTQSASFYRKAIEILRGVNDVTKMEGIASKF